MTAENIKDENNVIISVPSNGFFIHGPYVGSTNCTYQTDEGIPAGQLILAVLNEKEEIVRKMKMMEHPENKGIYCVMMSKAFYTFPESHGAQVVFIDSEKKEHQIGEPQAIIYAEADIQRNIIGALNHGLRQVSGDVRSTHGGLGKGETFAGLMRVILEQQGQQQQVIENLYEEIRELKKVLESSKVEDPPKLDQQKFDEETIVETTPKIPPVSPQVEDAKIDDDDALFDEDVS